MLGVRRQGKDRRTVAEEKMQEIGTQWHLERYEMSWVR
jgi:hypothetical protein